MSVMRMMSQAARHGVVSLRMADEAGMTGRGLRHHAAAEGWDRLYPGVWLLPWHDLDPLTRAAAAIEYLGPPVYLDRRTALAAHGLPGPAPTMPQLLRPHGLRTPRLRDAEVRRTRVLDDDEITVADGLPSVTAPRALLSAARDHDREGLRGLALSAETAGLLEPGDLDAMCLRRGAVPGSALLRRVAGDLRRDGSESGFEFLVRDRFAIVGLRPDPGQPVVPGATTRRIDIGWSALRVGVECQSYAYHLSRDALDRDATRLNELHVEGDWIVLLLTWQMLHADWDGFLGHLRTALRRRAIELGVPVPAGV